MRRFMPCSRCGPQGRFLRALRPFVGVVTLALLAAPAFAVTTNVTVAGVPPDQVQSVTLALGGTTVQATEDEDDQTGAAVWNVDTPETIPIGTDVAVHVRLDNGQVLSVFTTVGLGGAIVADAERLYNEALQSAGAAADNFTIHTAPGNVVKFIPNYSYPLPARNTYDLLADRLATRPFLNSTMWGIRPQVGLGAGQAADAGDLRGNYDLSDTLRIGAGFDYSGLQFRYSWNPDFSADDQGLTYEQQVADALAAINNGSASTSVAQDCSEWCHYGSSVGHPLGFRNHTFGDLLGGGPLRLEVNLSENGQDDTDWTSVGAYLASPDLGGAAFTGAADPFKAGLQQQLNQTLIDSVEKALQQGHDQDPVQGTADESGRFRAGRTYYHQGVRLDYDFGNSDPTDSNSGAGQASQGGGAASAVEDATWLVSGYGRLAFDLPDTESRNFRVGRYSDQWDTALRYAGEFGSLRIASAGGAAADSTVDPSEWWTWDYPSSWSPEIAKLLDQAGIEATNNSCRDKAPGPFLDWSDPNVEDRYRAHESGPQPFVLRLP